MIIVNSRCSIGTRRFPDATRVSTDEHNNLEVWGGDDGERLMWLVVAGSWFDVDIVENEDTT